MAVLWYRGCGGGGGLINCSAVITAMLSDGSIAQNAASAAAFRSVSGADSGSLLLFHAFIRSLALGKSSNFVWKVNIMKAAVFFLQVCKASSTRRNARSWCAQQRRIPIDIMPSRANMGLASLSLLMAPCN